MFGGVLQRANVIRRGPRRVARLRLMLRSLSGGGLQVRWPRCFDPWDHLLHWLLGGRLLPLMLLRLSHCVTALAHTTYPMAVVKL